MIKALSFFIDFRGKDTCKSIADYIDPTLELEIVDLGSYGLPEIGINDIVLVFGNKAAREVEGLQIGTKLIFDELSSLDSTFGQEECRQAAFEQLKKFKGLSEGQSKGSEPSSITGKSLPCLSSKQVLTQIEKGTKEWVGTTGDGKVVRLTSEKEEKGKEDICLTFSELFTLKMAMETLGIKEFQVVSKQKDQTQ